MRGVWYTDKRDVRNTFKFNELGDGGPLRGLPSARTSHPPSPFEIRWNVKIKEAEWKCCGSCQSRISRISDEEYGCDECGKPITPYDGKQKNADYLQFTVFFHGDRAAESKQFCCWKCAMSNLRKIKTDYFINMPYLNFGDDIVPGQRASDFFDLVKEREVQS